MSSRSYAYVSKIWLGHKSITVTVDLYGHLVPEASGRARDALDNAFRVDVPQSAPGDQ